MSCVECEERLGDLADGSLGVVVQREVERHLEGCEGCRGTRDALTALQSELRRARPEIGDDARLAARVAAATWRRPLTFSALWPFNPDRGGPPWRLQAAAGGMSVLVATFIYIGTLAVRDPRSLPARAYRTTNNAAADVRSRTESVLEDLRLARVLVSTAFGGRLDQVQDQVEDYRRLLEKKQPSPSPVPKDRTPEAPAS